MRNFFAAIITVFAINGYCQQTNDIIAKANKLVEDKKYESAFKLLDTADSTNCNPDIFLLKEDIVLNYFVSSLMHQAFALKDINKDEDIMDYRGKEGIFSMCWLEIDSILYKLIDKYPENCKLYKGLADYYYCVSQSYETWLIEEEELQNLVIENCKKTINGNCADHLTYYHAGMMYLFQEENAASIPYLKKATELDPTSADAHYNLAYAYLFNEHIDSALHHAELALKLYTDDEYKSDAAHMLGQIYAEKNEGQNALKYYEMADKIYPGNYYNLKPMIYLYLSDGNKKYESTTETFFNLAPENPTIYQDLEEAYSMAGKENELISFYKSQLSKYKDNNIIFGNLNFYLGAIYLGTDNKTAKKYFEKSKEVFKKVFKADHYIFGVIEDALGRCN